MPTVHKIDSVSVQTNNRRRRAKYNPNYTFLANKQVNAMPAQKDTFLNNFISKALDKVGPALFKYPKTGKKYFALGESFAKKAVNIQE